MTLHKSLMSLWWMQPRGWGGWLYSTPALCSQPSQRSAGSAAAPTPERRAAVMERAWAGNRHLCCSSWFLSTPPGRRNMMRIKLSWVWEENVSRTPNDRMMMSILSQILADVFHLLTVGKCSKMIFGLICSLRWVRLFLGVNTQQLSYIMDELLGTCCSNYLDCLYSGCLWCNGVRGTHYRML